MLQGYMLQGYMLQGYMSGLQPKMWVSEVNSNAKALRHFKVNPVWKIYEHFPSSLDLCGWRCLKVVFLLQRFIGLHCKKNLLKNTYFLYTLHPFFIHPGCMFLYTLVACFYSPWLHVFIHPGCIFLYTLHACFIHPGCMFLYTLVACFACMGPYCLVNRV